MAWIHRSDRISLSAPQALAVDAQQLQTIDYTGLWRITLMLSDFRSAGDFVLDGIPNQGWDVGTLGLAQPFPTIVSWGGAMLGDGPVLMEGKMNLRILDGRSMTLLIIREWITWEKD